MHTRPRTHKHKQYHGVSGSDDIQHNFFFFLYIFEAYVDVPHKTLIRYQTKRGDTYLRQTNTFLPDRTQSGLFKTMFICESAQIWYCSVRCYLSVVVLFFTFLYNNFILISVFSRTLILICKSSLIIPLWLYLLYLHIFVRIIIISLPHYSPVVFLWCAVYLRGIHFIHIAKFKATFILIKSKNTKIEKHNQNKDEYVDEQRHAFICNS